MATAGGLVFIGATNDNRFRAFDSKTGKELWETRLAMSAHANPDDVSRQERQAVRGGGRGRRERVGRSAPARSEALVVYALP